VGAKLRLRREEFMKRIWSSRPSPALVVAVVALVAALAGTAVAADPLATSSATVTKKKVKRIAKKVAKKQAKKKVNAFEAAKFPIGASDLATIDEHTQSETISPSTGGTLSKETATATCDTGERVISGGWTTELEQVGTDARVALSFEDQRSDNGWSASAVNLSGTLDNELTAHAYCLAP
jgi:metal-dependent amidase/aminoacylase/carboxypeptidase family protein